MTDDFEAKPLPQAFSGFRATVLAVHDGDTFTCSIDQGLGVHTFGPKGKGWRLRLYGFSAPEITGPEKALGLASRAALRSLIEGKEVRLSTYEDKEGSQSLRPGQWDRYSADVWVKVGTRWQHVQARMIKNGQGLPWDYEGGQPRPDHLAAAS